MHLFGRQFIGKSDCWSRLTALLLPGSCACRAETAGELQREGRCLENMQVAYVPGIVEHDGVSRTARFVV